jgi:pimeloyl-ACP methyl ester carboxylesterase
MLARFGLVHIDIIHFIGWFMTLMMFHLTWNHATTRTVNCFSSERITRRTIQSLPFNPITVDIKNSNHGCSINKININNVNNNGSTQIGRRRHHSQNYQQHRLYSSTLIANLQSARRFEDTLLGKNGIHLLEGLDRYAVPAEQDGHPLAVYGINSTDPIQSNESNRRNLTPILLLHGRTWSSVPVYHLLGGPSYKATGVESRSLMEALLERGLQPYAMDFRGFGGTPQDDSGHVEPSRCVEDTKCVLKWIAQRHGIEETMPADTKPALLGWSQGALIAQLVAQKTNRRYLSKLILYASIYDPLYRYPRDPLYRAGDDSNTTTTTTSTATTSTIIMNHYDSAIEDFTVEGTIPPDSARKFAEAALLSDPIKAIWKHTYQFNNIDPARVQVPCLVVAGDQDPYAPMHVQENLFCNLGRDSDRTWSILSGCDHAVHLLDGRFRLINILVSFINNDKRSEQRDMQ